MGVVVCLLIPTSNHNLCIIRYTFPQVVCLLIPTSNHNYAVHQHNNGALYAFWFLHQTTTWRRLRTGRCCCMPFDSYIKPQQKRMNTLNAEVVCLLIPTSNHNFLTIIYAESKVVCLLIPTSNHNFSISTLFIVTLYAFWFLHQTTTSRWGGRERSELYAFWFLHQTTTVHQSYIFSASCMPFDSYIKPQPIVMKLLIFSVLCSFFQIRSGV